MSLPDSPLVRTDALDRGIERVVVGMSVLGALGWPIWFGGAAGLPARLALALASVAALLCAWRYAGWCGGANRVRQGVWAADGFWTLEFADGDTAEGRLTSATRCVGPCALLAWRTDRGRSYVLVCAGRRSADEFRRLAARLRLEAIGPHEPAGAMERAA